MSTFASGKNSWSLCDRCGFRHHYRDITTEPGTDYRVCKTCNDHQFNLVTHPQNSPPPVYPDPQALRFPRPDVNVALDYEPQDEQTTPIEDGGPGGQ